MSDQIVDAEMARSLHNEAVRVHPLVAWGVMEDQSEHPGKLIARLIAPNPLRLRAGGQYRGRAARPAAAGPNALGAAAGRAAGRGGDVVLPLPARDHGGMVLGVTCDRPSEQAAAILIGAHSFRHDPRRRPPRSRCSPRRAAGGHPVDAGPLGRDRPALGRTPLEAYANGTDRSEQTECTLFFALHLLAEKAERAAFGPLCRLLLDAEAADLVLGDAITTTLRGILISTYDGNLAALQAVIEAEEADDYVRESALLALAYLVRTGWVPEAEMRAYLLHLLAEMQSQAEHFVWIGWLLAVAHLGFSDLSEQAEGLIRRGFVSERARGTGASPTSGRTSSAH